LTNDNRNNEELDYIISDLEELTKDLNYKRAQNSLRDLVRNFDLTAQEQAGLEQEIDRLSAMLDKLEQSVVQIAAFGMVGRGKSSILNALVGQEIFATGPLHGVTRSISEANWELTPEQLGDTGQDVQRLTLSSEVGKGKIQLIDTPGIDEVNGETREALACQLAKQVDLILFAIAGDMTKIEYEALSRLREAGKPMLLVFNKIDQYPEADREAIYRKIRDERVRELLSPDEIIMVAASPLEVQAVRDSHGKQKIQRDRGKPQVEELKLKILELLHREGKSLVALNTMLYADEVNEHLLERKLAIRNEAANQLIYRGTMVKAVAVALNPVMAIDLLTGAVVDVAIIISLSRLYGIPMTRSAAIALLQKIAVSMTGISASELLATLGLGSLKGILGLSVPITGGISLAPYLSVAIAQAGIAGVSSYAIGQVTKTYLANGASWGPDGPKTVVQTILDSLDEKSIINRIKSELTAKLLTSSPIKLTRT
jgi:small GTP-binding protein